MMIGLDGYRTLLLDMNGTFMFGHDRFGDDEDYGASFKESGGRLRVDEAHRIIRRVIEYLEALYPDPKYRECFPSIDATLDTVLAGAPIPSGDRQRLVEAIARHECGTISSEYGAALLELGSRFQVGLVADVWAPRKRWIDEFERAGVRAVFRAMSFSSDHGVVKPSPKPFLRVLREVGGDPAKAVVIGDSVRRDLGGAAAAGLPCILVGGATDGRAVASVASLLDLL